MKRHGVTLRRMFSALALFMLLLHGSALALTYYVRTDGNDGADGLTWSTAKQTIQAAVDLAVNSDTVLVSNGVYQTGGRVVPGYLLTNRVVITNSITLRSVNGPGVTTIRGAGHPGTTNGDAAVRCVYISAGARLSGFTLADGATRTSGYWVVETSGGGIWCEPDAVISNCTLSGNSAVIGGGVFAGGFVASGRGTLNNCTLVGNSADQQGGGASYAELYDCTLTGNRCLDGSGGGAASSMLDGCTLTANAASSGGGGAVNCEMMNSHLSGNSAGFGGGVSGSTLSNCTLVSNSSTESGGGANGGTLDDCTLTGNQSYDGGGAYGSTLNNCTVSGNTATHFGGGAMNGTVNNTVLSKNTGDSGGGSFGGTLNSSVLVGNTAARGGGAYGSTLNNCTVSRNTASINGGGSYYSTVRNSIEYFNTAPSGSNYLGSTFSFSCSAPAPGGTGNITVNPQFVNAAASNFHLQASSPCINTGSNGYVTVTADVEGNPRIINGTVDMGAYEYQIVTVSVTGNGGTVTGGGSYAAGTNILISAVSTNGHWFFTGWSDGGTNAAHTVTVPTSNITYTAIFTQYTGVLTFYVAKSGDDNADGGSWAAAKLTLQSAADLTAYGDMIYVSNGVYATGSSAAHGTRVALHPGVTMHSMNGPAVTIIDGADVLGCAYLGSNAALSGFTLTNGMTSGYGGGVRCEPAAVVSNCVISGNTTSSDGGGSYGGILYDCILTGNRASYSAGGSANGTLYRCTLSGNHAEFGLGGGANASVLYNCSVISNTAPYDKGGGVYGGQSYNCLIAHNDASYGGGASGAMLVNCTLVANNGGANAGGAGSSTLHNCIAYDNTSGGAGRNVDSCTIRYSCTTPLPGGAGNFTNDPVFVNAAAGDYRLAAGSPARDNGNSAYATNSLTDLDGYARMVNGYPDLGAYEYQGAGQGDYDGDGAGNGDERIAGTGFTDSGSVFEVFTMTVMSPASITFDSVTGRVYAADRTDGLIPNPQVWTEFTNGIAGTGGPVTINDSGVASNRHYRVRVLAAP